MKKALIALVGLSFVVALCGCNAEDKALETSAPPVSENANTYETGGQPKDVGERGPEGTDGPQGPAEKPPGY